MVKSVDYRENSIVSHIHSIHFSITRSSP